MFIDFSNEEDLKNVWYNRSIQIDGQVMWLEKCTPPFRSDEESPVVPIWVLLLELHSTVTDGIA